MSKIYLFDFDDHKLCVDLDTVRIITFRDSQIRLTFKDTSDVFEFNLSKSEEEHNNPIRTKEFYKKLIDFWME